MPILYDEQGTEIYAGRGKYSRRARSMIEQRSAYTRNDEGNLVVYVPDETQPVAPTSTTAWDDEVRAFKRKAGRLGGQLNMGLEKVEIHQTTDFGELVATLHQMSQPDLVAGLDSDQAAKLMQTFTYWMLRQHLSVFEHDELVRNLHALLNPMRAPATGASLINRGGNVSRDSAVNTVPGRRSSEVHNELWVHAYLPPNRHPCRPSVVPAHGEQGDVEGNLRNDGFVWQESAVMRGPDFVCDNLNDASDLSTFQRGRHGIIRVFLPYNTSPPHYTHDQSHHMPRFRDRGHLDEPHFSRENEPWSHCLQRFIDACTAVKNSVRPDLRLLIHRGADTPQEVIL